MQDSLPGAPTLVEVFAGMPIPEFPLFHGASRRQLLEQVVESSTGVCLLGRAATCRQIHGGPGLEVVAEVRVFLVTDPFGLRLRALVATGWVEEATVDTRV